MSSPNQNAPHKPKKLPRLPDHARIQKRAILHRPIASPYAGAPVPKIIYISTRTPFISAVKRVRRLLGQIDKRAMGKIDLVDGEGSDRAKMRALGKERVGEEVLLRATSRAIERVLGLALFFEGRGDCRVRVRTGSVGVVDDVVEGEGGKTGRKRNAGGRGQEGGENCVGGGDGVEAGTADSKTVEQEQELPETRVRKTSMVEVAISLL
ncbi:MAG: hypothetical protein M1830_004163 [Pleopsidium flavum]|nr:MAG: hypothetical protein M1830_004163 [Pleopsidium flavum]